MSLNQSYSRIDTLGLKAMIVQKIGLQRAEKYFDQLRRLFSFKMSKCEFNKFCIRTIGRENLPLHNQLIRSIVKNACLSKIPPTKGIRKVGTTLNVKIANGSQKNNLQSLYGDAFTPSPRKGRSPVSRDRKFRDRPSPLGPYGKPQSITCEELISKAQEQQSATELLSLGSRPPVEVVSVEDGEEVEQDAGSSGVQSRSPVTAPFGVSMNLGGARKTLSNLSYWPETCQNSGELPDTKSLRSRVKQKLEMEGLSMSVDCANLLNNGLDAYLKRLIEPSIRFAASRRENGRMEQLNSRHIAGANGTVVPGRQQSQLSLLDFHAAMELNPKLIGQDWALQLEKISLRASEE
ncbi:hypothetical protein CsatB_005306 [Cannabis sativa]